jgi:hypothetical protein
VIHNSVMLSESVVLSSNPGGYDLLKNRADSYFMFAPCESYT